MPFRILKQIATVVCPWRRCPCLPYTLTPSSYLPHLLPPSPVQYSLMLMNSSTRLPRGRAKQWRTGRSERRTDDDDLERCRCLSGHSRGENREGGRASSCVEGSKREVVLLTERASQRRDTDVFKMLMYRGQEVKVRGKEEKKTGNVGFLVVHFESLSRSLSSLEQDCTPRAHLLQSVLR